MKNINTVFELGNFASEQLEKDVTANELLNDDRRRVINIMLRAGSRLKRHNAAEPITVLCLSGTGTFHAGAELDETQEMQPGTLIALDPSIDHEVAATTAMSFLVSRFK